MRVGFKAVQTVLPAILLLHLTGPARAWEGVSAEPERQARTSRRILLERKAVLEAQRPYHPPRQISNRDPNSGVVSVTLEVKFATHTIEDAFCIDTEEMETHDVCTRTYNGDLVGGLIRLRPGDRLEVDFKNRLPNSDPAAPPGHNQPNGFNLTNLHTHGLHVSPEGKSDNVFLEIGPGGSNDYCFEILRRHTAGTFWYHAHRHGSVALQLSSGMAGPLLVDGGMDRVPAIAAAMAQGREKILVFQQIRFSLDEQGLGRVTPEDVYGTLATSRREAENCKQFQATLINGIHRPVIRMRPGEIQRWRCIHAGVMEVIPLSIREATNEAKHLWLHEIARDGLPLYRMERVASVELYPGYRSDFLVQAPTTTGKYLLKQERVPAAKALDDLPQDPRYLALVEVVDVPPVSMKLPSYAAPGAFALRPIKSHELLNRRPMPLVFEENNPKKEFLINGVEFDHNHIDIYPRLGTAEEWAISSIRGTHPFHIHVNPFEVFEATDSGIKRYWRDTLVVTKRNPPWNPIYVRMRFETFPGKTVLHCHNLVHEDQGMMMAIRIVGKSHRTACVPDGSFGLGTLPARAPDWKLRDAEGKTRRLADLSQRRILLVFFRGLACVHCRKQLQAIAQRVNELELQQLTVVAVCPDSPEQLKQQLAEVALPSSFTVLADESEETFRRYGCYDGVALHGVFLIDAAGNLCWQRVGHEPFLDIDSILKHAQRLK